MRKSKLRITLIGSANSGKTMFLPYLTGQMRINPPIAEAMQKCGYITKETEIKIKEEFFVDRLKKKFGESDD